LLLLRQIQRPVVIALACWTCYKSFKDGGKEEAEQFALQVSPRPFLFGQKQTKLTNIIQKHIIKQSMDKFLTIKEVAKILRVSERSVNRYIEAGRLRASRIGQWRIKQSDVDEFFKKNLNIIRNKK